MSVLSKLASVQNIRNTQPNKDLAASLAASEDHTAIKELVQNISSKNRNIQSDCIKVLYEIGERNPSLISPYAKEFLALLDSKNNRMQWGAMIAIDIITALNPRLVYAALGKIIAVADKGSVITNDHAVGILIQLCSVKQYAGDAFALLFERLQKCPTNQLPMYAENALPVITAEYKKKFTGILASRLAEIDKEPKRKRVEKVIKKLS